MARRVWKCTVRRRWGQIKKKGPVWPHSRPHSWPHEGIRMGPAMTPFVKFGPILAPWMGPDMLIFGAIECSKKNFFFGAKDGAKNVQPWPHKRLGRNLRANLPNWPHCWNHLWGQIEKNETFHFFFCRWDQDGVKLRKCGQIGPTNRS